MWPYARGHHPWALIVVLGISAQWLAWQLRLPSILLLLTFGFVAGPVTHLLDPDHLFSKFNWRPPIDQSLQKVVAPSSVWWMLDPRLG